MTNNDFNSDQYQQLLGAVLRGVNPAQHAEVTERFRRQAPLLTDRLGRLYGNASGYPDWLIGLMQALGTALTGRPEALRELDRERERRPDWFLSQNSLGYCAYVDRLGGTLAGVQEQIPHLRELGVTYLHLLPFLRARDGENDGGFAVAAFDQVQPELGSMRSLTELAAALREAGISLCSDFILNHVADSHPWAQAARDGDQQAQAFFYTYPDRTQPDQFEADLNQVFPQAAPGNFTFCDALQRWVWTTFYPYQWDFNYANPQVFLSMTAAMMNLANQGVEVFRLDSTAYLWKRADTACMNQPEVHWILQAMRCIIDIVAPAVLLKAEAIVPTAELPGYLGGVQPHVPECHLAYHSTLMAAAWTALATQSVDLLRKVMLATPTISAPVSWLTYVRCHDDIGWNVLLPEANLEQHNGPQFLSAAAQFLTGANGGFGRGENFQANTPGKVHGTNGMTAALCGMSSAQNGAELDTAIRRMLILYGLAASFGGMPLIYMGDELGQDNDCSYLDDPSRNHDSRWLQRPFLDRAAMQRRHDTSTRQGKIFGALCTLMQTRARLPELSAGSRRTLLDSGSASVLAFARGEFVHGQEDSGGIIWLGNFSDQTASVDLVAMTGLPPGLTWTNMPDQTSHCKRIDLLPWSQLWLKPDVH